MKLDEKWLVGFGARLKTQRVKQGLTQQNLAKKAHTKQDYIAQLERGARNPTLRTLINILSALNVSADCLIYGDVNTEAQGAIDDFISFLKRRSSGEITSYYEIVKFLSQFIEN